MINHEKGLKVNKWGFAAFAGFILLKLFFTTLAFAEQDFSSDYMSEYVIETTGTADVTSKIKITNKSKDFLATTYTLVLKQLHIFDVHAFAENKPLVVDIKENENETSLDIRFNDFVVGEGSSTELTIRYKSTSIAGKVGNIWNINIPRIQSDTISTAEVRLLVPDAFGPKIYVSPTPVSENVQNNSILYLFPADSLINSNISASFGKQQTLNFRLKYQIQNPNLYSSYYEIALPPTIKDDQLVVYQNLFPRPDKSYTDKDGNYIATFRLKPKEQLQVGLTGSVLLNGGQFDPTSGGEFKNIPHKLMGKYFKQASFWETTSESITTLAGKLKDEKLTVAQNAQKIYDYLVQNYNYDFGIAKKDYVDRKGALSALGDKKGWGCMEFTDSFIAIARAMRIPAREINGYALTTTENTKPISITLKSGDLLHAWPEFFDPKLGWLQIDPTWGNTSNTDYFTKQDTNHFAFTIKGINPSYPLPAGSYRLIDNQKLVEVDYSQVDEPSQFEGDFTLQKVINFNIVQLFKKNVKYKVTNTSQIVLFDELGIEILPGNSRSTYLKKTVGKITLFDAFGTRIEKQLGI